MMTYEETQNEYEALIQTKAGQAVAQGYDVHQAVNVPLLPKASKDVLPFAPMVTPPLPPLFPLDALPKVLMDMAQGVACNQRVAVDIPAIVGLAVFSSCACGRISIDIRKDWNEPLNLYFMPVVPSGEGKTPVFRAMQGEALKQWQAEENHSRRISIAQDQAELSMLQAQKEAETRKKMGADRNKVRHLAEEIERFKETMHKPIKRFIDGDVTAEQLLVILSENDHGAVSVLDDDAGQWLDILLGQHSSVPNITA